MSASSAKEFQSPVVSVELHYGKPLHYGDKPVVQTKLPR